MDKWEYQNKPCFLENRVVREPCKWRTACTINQSHYIEVAKGAIFMEQNMKFGPVGNTEKNGGSKVWNFWGCFFNVFNGKKHIFILKIL